MNIVLEESSYRQKFNGTLHGKKNDTLEFLSKRALFEDHEKKHMLIQLDQTLEEE